MDGIGNGSSGLADRIPNSPSLKDQAKIDSAASRLSVADLGRLTGESLAGVATTVKIKEEFQVTSTQTASALDQSNANLMGDAPACTECGTITVRNGTCYRCLNCGNSMGCS
jgi:ribonucleoside-diphosphate reductase alpha chain